MLAWQRLHLATALFNVRIGGESPIFAAVPEDTLLAAIAMSIMTNAESIQRTFQRFEEEREEAPLQVERFATAVSAWKRDAASDVSNAARITDHVHATVLWSVRSGDATGAVSSSAVGDASVHQLRLFTPEYNASMAALAASASCSDREWEEVDLLGLEDHDWEHYFSVLGAECVLPLARILGEAAPEDAAAPMALRPTRVRVVRHRGGGDDQFSLWHYTPADGEPSTNAHQDSSDITLNACLSTTSLAGGELTFSADTPEAAAVESEAGPDGTLRVAHQAGVALLHRGAVTHEVAAVTAGERVNLIVWYCFVEVGQGAAGAEAGEGTQAAAAAASKRKRPT